MRNKLLDCIRLLAAFLVILIHAPLPGKAGQAMEAVSRVAVPLFFMISGYYAWAKSKERLLKSAKKTGILLLWSVSLYFVWEILWYSYKGTTAEYLDSVFSARTFVETVIFNNGSLLGHLWFLLALLQCYLFYALVLRKTSLPIQTGLIVVLLLGFFLIREILKLNSVSDPIYYLRNFLFVGIPFFLLGGIINRQSAHFVGLPTPVLAVLVCTGTAVAIVERFTVGCCDLYAGTVIAAVALFVLAQKPGISGNKVLAALGEKYAGDIYIFHSLIIGVFNAAASVAGILHMGVFAWVRPVLVFAVSIGVAYVRQALKKQLLTKRGRA